MKYNKKTEWKSHLGNTVTIEGIADEHLANTIQFIAKYYHNYSTKLLTEFKKEAKRRGLSKEFLDRAPFPYRDGKGNWIVWCYKTNRPKVVGSYLRK